MCCCLFLLLLPTQAPPSHVFFLPSSQDDRSLINLHLMHTSYFLFVMVITMFCYAVIKGRPSKLRQSSPELCPEKVGAWWGCWGGGGCSTEHTVLGSFPKHVAAGGTRVIFWPMAQVRMCLPHKSVSICVAG